MQHEYKSELKSKEMEIQKLQKQQLRDSIRLALKDLGDIHYKFGYLHEAITKWATSHDYSSVKEDKL